MINVYDYLCISSHLYELYEHVSTSVDLALSISMYACMYIYIYTHMFVVIYSNIYLHVLQYVSVCHVDSYMFHIYIFIYVYIHK